MAKSASTFSSETSTLNPSNRDGLSPSDGANIVLGTSFSSLEDMLALTHHFPDGKSITATPHLFGRNGSEVVLIPYNDEKRDNQPELAKLLEKEELLISVKHHTLNPKNDITERLKLQCTHIQIAVPVENGGVAGAITINNPQNYQGGLFGENDYPMIFLKVRFPSGISASERKAYLRNIKAWAVVLNTFSKFPGDYNGGDPLSGLTSKEIHQFGLHALKALTGSEESREWLLRPKNQLYCAELAYMAINLGILIPLNKNGIPEDLFMNVKEELNEKRFLNRNENPHIGKVKLEMAPDDLKPLMEVASGSLAITPFHISHMIENYIKLSIPREKYGEDVAKYQYELLVQCKDLVKGMVPELSAGKATSSFDKAFEEIATIVSKRHENYAEFRASLSVPLGKLNALVKKASGRDQTFIPPHCFLVKAVEFEKGDKQTGILSIEYAAHGFHEDFFHKKPSQFNQEIEPGRKE